MDIQRLRNLTTGRLHTSMDHIYEDFAFFTGHDFCTHQLPNALEALLPFLRKRVLEARFWDYKFDTTHVGQFAVKPLDADELNEFLKAFGKLRDPLFG